MRMLLVIFTLCFGVYSFAKVGTYHKTADGKYPIYYADVKGQENAWTDNMQKEYDDKMDETINELCVDTVAVQRAQEIIKHENEVGKSTGFVDKVALHDAGSVLVNMKPIVERLSKIVKDGTGKDASSYECP